MRQATRDHTRKRSPWAMVLSAALGLGFGLSLASAASADPDPTNWPAVLEEARGERVYFNAWGGEPRVNGYLEWVADTVSERYGVTLIHVKVTDAADVVGRVLAEQTAGRTQGGSVDLIWINGENFAAMKRADLLFSPGWAPDLPNYVFVDVEGKPTVEVDFTVPTEGLQAPWGMAQLTFYHDTAFGETASMPRTPAAFLEWVQANPGRFTYPQPPDFLGSTFLKQMLIGLTPDPAVLAKPMVPERFDAAVEPLFAWLDALHPHLWRSGRAFPPNQAALRRLLADGETDIAFSFHPAEASSAIASGELPDTVRSFVMDGGTIGNTHFVAIPFNANAKAGALVVANFLMSPEAQARKLDPRIWGDGTVLDLDALTLEDRALFDALPLGIATLTPEELGTPLPEPHPSWMEAIEATWAARYAG